jgi:hypothetical protein
VPRDANGNQDVYEFEPEGVGSCSPGSTSGNVSYLPAARACVGLISSGTAAGESAFLDASEGGGDVFFLTDARLVAGDVDTAIDVYDAHVCSSEVPCLAQTEPPPPCSTADSCRAAPAAQPSIFGAPASAEFVAPNAAPPGPPKPPRPVPLTNRQRLAKALAACHRRYAHRNKRRIACERAAHRRYPIKRATKGRRR